MNKRSYISCIIYLIKCAVTGELPDIDISEADPEMLFDIAESHRIANILFVPLSNMGVDMSAEGWSRFQKSNEIGVMLSFQQEYYLNEISRLLREHEIRFMPLKGSIIKYLYPTPDMRQSSDIDILFDEGRADEVKAILEAEGFTNTFFGRDQDVYVNNNIVIEMHRSLLPDRSPWYDEVKNMEQRAVTGDGYRYAMTDEDFYVFDIVHIAKHVSEGGIGIRAVLDIWVYLNNKDKLDRNVINDRLQKLGLQEFERNIRQLSEYWFNGGESTEQVKKLEAYIASSGWVGTAEQKLALMSEEHAKDNKLLYAFNYIFQPAKKMQGTYKYLRKYPFLAPIAWGDRLIKALFVRKGAVKKFWHRYDNVSSDKIHELKGLMKEIGL